MQVYSARSAELPSARRERGRVHVAGQRSVLRLLLPYAVADNLHFWRLYHWVSISISVLTRCIRFLDQWHCDRWKVAVNLIPSHRLHFSTRTLRLSSLDHEGARGVPASRRCSPSCRRRVEPYNAVPSFHSDSDGASIGFFEVSLVLTTLVR